MQISFVIRINIKQKIVFYLWNLDKIIGILSLLKEYKEKSVLLLFFKATNKNELKIWWLNYLYIPLHPLTISKGV